MYLWEEVSSTFSYSATMICCFFIAKSCLTLCDPEDCSMQGFPVFHYLPEFAQTHVHWGSDAIQPFHPLLPFSPPASNLSQHQDPVQRISSSHQVAKGLELQHQSFQRAFRVEFLYDWLVWSPCFPRENKDWVTLRETPQAAAGFSFRFSLFKTKIQEQNGMFYLGRF